MFDPVCESSFRLDVAGLSDPFEVLAFTGSEAISEPFAFEIDVLIDDPQLDLAGLLYRFAYLCFGPSGEGVHGQLQSLVQHEHGLGSRLCRIRLGPKLGCLDLRISQRIFSGRSVPQIIEQVLREHGIVGAQRRFELHGDYPARTFCTQYRESDLQLLQRLCAQARIHYFFEHGRDRHCLVFGDDQAQLPLAGAALYQDVDDGHRVAPTVHHWQFEEILQADSRQAQRAEGRSDLTTLRSGHWLRLVGHPFAECNRQWLLTRIEHCADPSLDLPYANRLFAAAQLSPAAVAAASRLRMHSLQRAWVVTVDEPQPDRFRPVAVQFDWLYQGEGAAPSHCWLPLAPSLAEAPLAALGDGVEVVVSFFEGDPDQPMISGVLQPPMAVAQITDDPPLPLPDKLVSEGLQQLLASGEPLLLLCLIPGGGSFSHCAEAVCSCRLMASLEQSGAT
ncbi:type VI secretion protein [Pseudomonas sp. MPR-ANC1]|uniref:type VI secretion system Vgr family protein n=1 Tax=Pseudomonas sp. MPR-ANC1 TaxID=2075548 RepID=UPI000CD1906F|nr:contractile injection system protein, VgrG/Pvc8 family [Pseudomonas sp. MPR-ANC1]POA45213.1 type VI secretion protein [Pseudomonas sp. MPR-ANC1]